VKIVVKYSLFLDKIQFHCIMPETTCEKIKRHCLPLTYAFSFSHVKSVLIGMVTEYESKLFYIHKKNKIN
jgi:hypothetical protein